MSPGRKKCFLNFVITCCFSLFFGCDCIERDMTISIPARREECFYETLKNGETLDIDYQVIDGGHGNLDISFHLSSPSNQVIVMDHKKSEKSHRHEVKEDGDYKLCFDNKFSMFSSKTVYFEILIDSDNEDTWYDFNKQTEQEQYEIAIQDIEEVVRRVKNHLFKIRHLQELVKTLAARDKNMSEYNFFKVNTWSILQTVVMIVVGFVQVVMVKKLFDDQSKVHKIWGTR